LQVKKKVPEDNGKTWTSISFLGIWLWSVINKTICNKVIHLEIK